MSLTHLPEGREPGPQSRRRASGQRVGGMVWIPKRLRGRAADAVEGVALSVTPAAIRRGEEVEARLAGSLDPRLELGLVCDVWYDVEVGSGEDRSRTTKRALVWEDWRPSSPAMRFRVPEDGPYSWEGTNLSFGWRIVARQADQLTSAPFWVDP